MSAPEPHAESVERSPRDAKLLRAAIWVAIGALIAAAFVCVIWVLVGSQNGIVGRAFLTILLLAAFAGVTILDVHLSQRRPTWFALTSMVVWVVTLLIGAFMIWMPVPAYGYGYGFGRVVSFLLIVLVLQLAVLHVRLYTKAHQRYVTTFTSVVTYVTIALIALLTLLLVLPLMLWEWLDFSDLYWRFVVATAILDAVGTALIPLMNALFAPKPPRPAPAPPVMAWPTYADGVTPLPVMPDGSPDWNAYYTGYPSTVPQAIAPTAPLAPPQAYPPAGEPAAAAEGDPQTPPGYRGYPPPPPPPQV